LLATAEKAKNDLGPKIGHFWPLFELLDFSIAKRSEAPVSRKVRVRPRPYTNESGKKWPIFGPKSFLAFSAVASKRGWEPLVREFAAHNLHMPLLKTYPSWVRFSEDAERQSPKKAIFTCLEKNEKINFYKL
jgi:hypothetical protein